MFTQLRHALISADPSVDLAATEKMNYNMFVRNEEAFRLALIPGRITELAHVQLPNLSTLHTINHFLHPQAADDCNPDPTNPFLVNEQFSIYLNHQITLPTKTTKPFPVADQITYVANRYKAQTVAFFQHQHHLRRMMSESSLVRMPNVLLVHEYAALNHARLTGQLATYRHFDLILRAMLDHICASNDQRHHFLQFPISNRIYTRAQLLPALTKLSVSTLRVLNDPSYFLLIHLLGLVYGEQNDEPSTTLSKTDLAILETDTDPPLLTSTSLFARLPEAVLSRLHLVLTIGSHAILYNLGDLKAMAGETPMMLRVLRHVTMLKSATSEVTLPDAAVDDATFDAELEAHQQHEPQPEPVSVSAPMPPPPAPVTPPVSVPNPPSKATDIKAPPLVTPAVSPVTPSPVVTSTTSLPYQQHVVQTLKTKLSAAPETHAIPHTHIETLYDRHLAVRLNGKTIAQHLAMPIPDIHTNTLDFLHSPSPDPSMTSSSIANLDTLYIDHMLYHDVAKTLTSLVSQGLFVTDIEETPERSEWTRRVVTKVSLVDVQGKRHSLTFALPEVDASGQMIINGVPTRMTKQQINLPICKVGPDRVNLSSNYNKTLVERTSTRRHSFSTYITTYITALRKAGFVEVQYGKLPDSPMSLPYDYAAVGQVYTKITGKAGWLHFDPPTRFRDLSTDPSLVETLTHQEKEHGIFLGRSSSGPYLFMGLENNIREVTLGETGPMVKRSITLVQLLQEWYPDITAPPLVSEWTELKVLDESFPIIFVLGFRFGLSHLLTHHAWPHRWIPSEDTQVVSKQDLVIPFADGRLVVPRYPLPASLLLAGLLKYPTKSYQRADFDSRDVYYRVLTTAGISTNYLKGILSFFDFFLDPITIDVLQHMGEPTTVPELLIRASDMLSDYAYHDSASMRHHRLRGYERFAGVLYNEMARQLSAYQNKRTQKKSFSINPEAVFQRLAQDATMSSVETINPVYEIKTNTAVTYAGSGGRTAKSFVVEDRRYPEDAVGVLSESTPDSQKVAMNTYTSSDPKLANIRGMFDTNHDTLTPANVLSATALLFPCSVQDD